MDSISLDNVFRYYSESLWTTGILILKHFLEDKINAILDGFLWLTPGNYDRFEDSSAEYCHNRINTWQIRNSFRSSEEQLRLITRFWHFNLGYIPWLNCKGQVRRHEVMFNAVMTIIATIATIATISYTHQTIITKHVITLIILIISIIILS